MKMDGKWKSTGNLIRTIKICSQDQGIEFDIEKLFMLIMKSKEIESAEGNRLPNQEFIWTPGEKENKYLRILEADQWN